MIPILADENFPGNAVAALKNEGYDILWIHDFAPGINDKEVLNIAIKEKRILVTLDKDFGEIAFKYGLPAECGVILFRLPCLAPALMIKTIINALKSRADWAHHFSVIEMNRIRMRPVLKVLPIDDQPQTPGDSE